jgi:type II secretory pathway component PulF
MAVFATAPKRLGRLISGVIEADTDAMVVDRLRDMGFFITNPNGRSAHDVFQPCRVFRYRPQGLGISAGGLPPWSAPASRWSAPIDPRTADPTRLKGIIAQVRGCRAGRPLSDAMGRHPKAFSSLCQHGQAGETGGVLD